jgi:uncharacterized protein
MPLKRKIFLTVSLLFISISILFITSCKKEISRNPDSLSYSEQEEDTTKAKEPSEATAQSPAPIKYEYRWKDSTDIPPIAIVIDDFGQIGGDLLQGFAELDENITFAILPDLPNTKKSAQLANVYGHEVLIHIPMQALDSSQNPGKVYIRGGESEDDIRRAINGFLDQVPQAVGANNHMGSRATSDYDVMTTVMKTLDKQGLFFLDSRTNNKSQVVNVARDTHLDYAARDIFLDVPDVSNATLNAKLASLEKYKGRVEPVVIISHCHNKAKLEAMRSFIAQLKVMGIKLIPISDAVKRFQTPA